MTTTATDFPTVEHVTFRTSHRCGITAFVGIRRVWPIDAKTEEVVTTCANCESRRSSYIRKRKCERRGV